jgi:hypothetical protein
MAEEGRYGMATAPTQTSWTVDDLLAAVQQLPPADFREFQRRLALGLLYAEASA